MTRYFSILKYALIKLMCNQGKSYDAQLFSVIAQHGVPQQNKMFYQYEL